jgi:hypothetical protein
MEKDIKYICFTTPTIKKDTITFYGAGKFGEERLILNKEQAILAYMALNKFLFEDKNSK